MFSRNLLVRFPVLVGLVVGVAAQGPQDTASCLPGYEWNQNSLGQDPCTIATRLDAACRSDPLYYYQKLNASEWYVPPSKTHDGDMDCDCDTVMYSLTMACSTCQGGISYGWDKWEAACNTVLISNYSSSIPQGTAVPYWAFYNVTQLTDQEFSNSFAQSLGTYPEAYPPPQQTNSSPGPTGTTTGKSTNKTAAIIGGAVGGAAVVIFVPIFVYFCCRHQRNKKERAQQAQWDYTAGSRDSRWKSPPHSPSTATYSLSNGPTVSSHLPSQPYIPQMPQPNRVLTYVTPMNNGTL